MKGSRGQRSANNGNNAGALQEGHRKGGGGVGRGRGGEPPGLQGTNCPVGVLETCASALAQGGDITFQGRSYKLGTQRPVLPSSDQHEESIRDTEGDGDSVEDRCRASASCGWHHKQE